MYLKSIITVVTAASDQLLISRDNLKIDLNITKDSYDAYLTRAIAAASSDIAIYCGRVFNRETVDETYYLDEDRDVLILSRYPVSSITSVLVDGVAVDSSEYTVDKENGLLIRLDEDDATPVIWEEGTVVVRYVGGYAAVPADLQTACGDIVKGMFYSRQRDPTIRSETIPNVYQASYRVIGPGEGDYPIEISSVLNRYRKARL